jgi:hypothetical protein
VEAFLYVLNNCIDFYFKKSSENNCRWFVIVVFFCLFFFVAYYRAESPWKRFFKTQTEGYSILEKFFLFCPTVGL